jgi:hypothetical protein
MPAEEDLNSWSHHYSTLTCEDEALKLATHMDSTVRFVYTHIFRVIARLRCPSCLAWRSPGT